MICTNCQTENPDQAKFCGQCGAKLEAVKTQQDMPYAERRQLTVLFSDLVGSTALSDTIDPEDMRAILHDYQAACTSVVGLYDGFIAKYLGDGILAYFGYPTAHEDDARRAVQAGLGIIEAIKTISERYQRELQVPIDVRVGIHTGLVVVGDMDKKDVLEANAIVGQTPNLAARIQSIAEPGALVVSDDTYKLVKGYFEHTDLGTHELKGISQAIRVHRIDHASTARSRLEAVGNLTPFAGRDKEIHTLESLWHRSQEGNGQIVFVSGEAGVGKSRLIHSIKEYAANDPDSWLTELRCSPYHHNSSFYPVIDFLERIVLRYERDETPQEKLTKIEGFALQNGQDTSEAVPLLASLLSVPLAAPYSALAITPQRQKQRIIELLVTVMLHRSKLQPVLFILEDLHWADPSTLELLDKLLERSVNHNILVFLSYRPQFVPYWTKTDVMTFIELAGLPRKNAEEIILRVSNNKAIPKEALDYIISKTDGIPLFLEELTKSMIESEMLIEKGNIYQLSAPLHTLGVPTSIQDSLTARLDRLTDAKPVAQLAATIGREFSYEILEAIPGGHTATLQSQLEKLVQAGILYQKGAMPNATFSFKHALIQDSAYSSLLKTSRKDFHKLIAETFESKNPELIETQPELLAQHYTKAQLPQKAIQYWLAAGVRALQRSANAEAVAHLRQGLTLTTDITDPILKNGFELQLYSCIGPALIAMKGFADEEIGETYKRAGELSLQLGDGPHLFTPLWGQWVYYLVRGDLNKAKHLATEMHRIGSEAKDTALLVEAHWTLGNTQFWLGNFEASLDNLSKAVEIYDPERHHIGAYLYGQDPGVAAHCYRMYANWSIGKPDTAREAVDTALSLAQTLRHPFSIGWAMAFSFTLDMLNRDFEAALANSTKGVQFCTEQVYPFWLFAGLVTQGWAMTMLGDPSGIALIEHGLGGWQMIGSVLVRPALLNLYAEALAKNGQVDKALEVIDGAITLAKEINEVASEIDLYRVRGECLALAGKLDEAETSIRQGYEYAKKFKALSRELIAATALTKVLQKSNREKEGIALIKETMSSFTEGFDAAFMQEAKRVAGEA
jgi:class 3 adenylate cyclase/tetratricopeptide (TPR) repeat protein